MRSSVYWIRHPDHTDMFTQGYVGVSRDVSARFEQHRKKNQNPHLTNSIKKYGWDFLIKQILLVGKKQYCLDIEKKLRSIKNTGWNLVIGGGQPPVAYGNKARLGMSSWNKGLKSSEELIEKSRKSHLGQVPWNKGLKSVHLGRKHSVIVCPHCQKSGGSTAMPRWHFDNCKLKDNLL